MTGGRRAQAHPPAAPAPARDAVGQVIAVAAQRRVRQAIGPAAAALAAPSIPPQRIERLRQAAAAQLEALALAIEMVHYRNSDLKRRPRNGRSLKQT